MLLLSLIAVACGSSTVDSAIETDSDAAAAIEDEVTDELAEEEAVEGDATQEPVEEDPAEEEMVDEPEPEPAAEPEPEAEPDEGVEVTTDFVFDDPVVLIDPGAEPRTELRLRLRDGAATLNTTQTQTFTQAIDGDTLVDGVSQVIESVTNISVTAQDDVFQIQSIVSSMEAADGTDPSIVETLNAALQESVGLTTEAFINSRGLLGSSSVESGFENEAIGDLLDAAGMMSNPFPKEAVGIGAVWEVNQSFELSGFEIEQVVTMTVTDIDGDIVSLAFEADQSVPAGAIGGEPGQPITANQWESVATGAVILDLTAATPIESTTTTSSSQVLEINGSVLDQQIEISVFITGG